MGMGFYVSIDHKYATAHGDAVVSMKLKLTLCQFISKSLGLEKFFWNPEYCGCKFAKAGVFDTKCPGQFCIAFKNIGILYSMKILTPL
jgi:hypothetical protein